MAKLWPRNYRIITIRSKNH